MEIHNDNKHELTCKEREMLKQFRKMLSDVIKHDDTDTILLKWLRAKNFDLRKCEHIYREHVRTIQMQKLDIIEDIWEEPEVIQKYEFANSLGFAKDGTPIHYIDMGRGDLKGFTMSLDGHDICKYCTTRMEKTLKRCKEQSKKLSKEINEITFIVDMQEFNPRQILSTSVVELGCDLFRMLQDHYPEVWKYIFIVNAPVYFYSAFNIFKPIFRHSLLKNFRVVSKEETPRLLLKYIDADVLPAFLGGNLVDSQGNPICSEFMKFGEPIPEEYYLRNLPLLQPTDEGVEEVWVSRGGCYNYSVVVYEADSVLQEEVRTEGGSMVFTMLFRKFGSNPDSLDLPSKDEYLDVNDVKSNVVSGGTEYHLQGHVSPLNNYRFAPWPGIYIFRFDNTCNWLTSRKVIFRFRVLPPRV